MTWLYYVIPSLLAVVSAGVVIYIYIRVFPKASALDLEAMPTHRQQQRKASLVEERLRRKVSTLRLSLAAFFKPIVQVLTKIFAALFKSLTNLEQRYRQAAKGIVSHDADTTATVGTVTKYIQDGTVFLEQGKLGEAENKFIAAIGLDARAIDAYRGLANVYEGMNDLTHAVATLQFLVRVNPKDEPTYLKLSQLLSKEHKYEDALEAVEQALELGPNNPKNLDAAIELTILNKLKYKAQGTLDALKKVNPDNQKLLKYQEQIDAM